MLSSFHTTVSNSLNLILNVWNFVCHFLSRTEMYSAEYGSKFIKHGVKRGISGMEANQRVTNSKHEGVMEKN
jgi:hypothetical protein